MKLTDMGVKFAIPFGANAAPGNIQLIPPTQSAKGRASMQTGFPPENFMSELVGGIPPWGADHNGILFQLSEWAMWHAAGGPAYYDAAFAQATGGYPSGAVLGVVNSTPGSFWVSQVDNNLVNPDAGPSPSWYLFSTVGLDSIADVNAKDAAVLAACVQLGGKNDALTHPIYMFWDATDGNYIGLDVGTPTGPGSATIFYGFLETTSGSQAKASAAQTAAINTSEAYTVANTVHNDNGSSHVIHAYWDGTGLGITIDTTYLGYMETQADAQNRANAAEAAAVAQIVSAFNTTLGQSGHQYYVNGQLEQWGAVAVNPSGVTTVTFPIAFPNAVLNIQMTEAAAEGWLGGGNYHPTFHGPQSSPSTTGFTAISLQVANGGAISPAVGSSFFWRAIGH